METDYKNDLDALERACEEVLDAETLKKVKVVAAKRRIATDGNLSPAGNAAALREALEDSQSLLESFSRGEYGAQVREQMRDNQAALSATPRNCDVYKTSWEVVTHWDGGLDSTQSIVRMLDWLLAPATERKGEKALNESDRQREIMEENRGEVFG